jgi:hypothetical protein
VTGTTLAQRLVDRLAARSKTMAEPDGASRRGFLGGATLVGAALATSPWTYLTRPADALTTVCGADSACADGYTVFCCTINGGSNTCPPDSFIGGWWKADNASFCGGAARYYVDCNAYRDGRYTCHCNQTTCDQRRVACNQFRYGQCNTQIPYSNTGPVLCRLVSCTPPWIQYGGTCGTSSATDNQTVSHTAPCLTARPPVGTMESATASGNLVRIKGWTYDPDQPATSLRVVIYADGKPLTVVTANQPRPDVDAALHITGNHGYGLSINAPNGVHQYRAYAMSVGGGPNALIGVHNVAVNLGSAPVGNFESATVTGNLVTLKGWALDRDTPTAALRVVVYADGKPYTVLTTNVLRPDVNAVYRTTGNHGFSLRFAAPAGVHNYRLYAMNAGGGSGNPLIGSHNAVVPATTARVSTAAATESGRSSAAVPLDAVAGALTGRPGARSVRLTGQLPPDAGGAGGSPVAIVQDGEAVTLHPLDAAGRLDVVVPASPGVHTYRVHLAGGSGTEPDGAPGDQATEGPLVGAVGTVTLAVDTAGPIGEVTRLSMLGRTVRLEGWAGDEGESPVDVAVIVRLDGRPVSRLRVAPDAADPAGRRRFEVDVPCPPGHHLLELSVGEVSGRQENLLGRYELEVDGAEQIRGVTEAVGARA